MKAIAGILQQRRFLLLIILLGISLRVFTITWGIPLFDTSQKIYYGDEAETVVPACKFPPQIAYGTAHSTFYHYFLGVVALPVKGIFLLCHTHFVKAFFLLYLFCRIISLLFAIGAIYMTFVLGKKLYDEKTALLASLFVSVSMYHAITSSMALPYTPLCFLMLLAFLKLFDLYEKPTLERYILIGIITGVLIGTKYTGLLFIIPVLIGHAMTGRRAGGKVKGLLKIGLFMVAAITVFIITTPTILSPYIHNELRLLAKEANRNALPLYDMRLWIQNFGYIAGAVGMPLALLYILGLIFPFRREPKEILILSLIASFYLYYLGGVQTRFLVTIVPLFALLASNAVLRLYRRIYARKLRFLMTGVVIAAIVYSASYCIGASYLMINDTRTRAARFIAQNIPAGSTVGIAFTSPEYGWKTHGWAYPLIDFSRYKEVDFLSRPDILVMSSTEFSGAAKALRSEHLLPGYIWDDRYNNFWYRFSPPTPQILRFFDEVLNKNNSGYILIESFTNPVFEWMPEAPPEIRIYKRTD